MNCPVCKTEMVGVKVKGVQIDACPKCEGIWLDRGELKRITGVDQKKARKVTCPKCKQTMSMTILRGVEIDVCPDCEAVWLDNGELEKLAPDKKFAKFLEELSSVASQKLVRLEKGKKKK